MVGSIIKKFRGQELSNEQVHYYAQMLADAVLVSTPDLLSLVHKGEYIPIPVDLQHLNQIPPINRNLKSLTINTGNRDTTSNFLL